MKAENLSYSTHAEAMREHGYVVTVVTMRSALIVILHSHTIQHHTSVSYVITVVKLLHSLLLALIVRETRSIPYE